MIKTNYTRICRECLRSFVTNDEAGAKIFKDHLETHESATREEEE